MTVWNDWERKERKARATLLRSVSDSICTDIMNLWDAATMYAYVTTEHTVDTIEHHGQIEWRLTNLKLPPQPTSTQMTDHLNHFQQLLADLQMAGGTISESVKCERLILTFPCRHESDSTELPPYSFTRPYLAQSPPLLPRGTRSHMH